MLARRLTILTIIAIAIGHAAGNTPFISQLSFLINLTPSSEGLASKINIATATSLSLSIIFCLLVTVIYSLLNKEDLTVAQIFEWYGCLIFGGALFLFFYWLITNVWATGFPPIQHGRAAKALYHLSLKNELSLSLACFILFLMGNFGLYILTKVPLLLHTHTKQRATNKK
jgi:hypothetical protein